MFKRLVIDDRQLGPLKRHGKRWEGTINLCAHPLVALDIEGTREAPHPETLDCAYRLPDKLPELIPTISNALLEHLEPYRDALLDPNDGLRLRYDDPDIVPKITSINSPELAWSAITIAGVEIGWDGKKVILLIKVDTPWDIEHTVGAFFEDWRYELLNGSV